MDKNLKARQFNQAIQTLIQSSDLTESEMMEYTEIYPTFDSLVIKGQELPIGYILSYGKNENDETQLYQTLQAVTPSETYLPNVSNSLYKAIGYSDDGTQIWTQPLGSTDAYMVGDIVSHNDKTWVSVTDNNVWEPGIYGWEEID